MTREIFEQNKQTERDVPQFLVDEDVRCASGLTELESVDHERRGLVGRNPVCLTHCGVELPTGSTCPTFGELGVLGKEI